MAKAIKHCTISALLVPIKYESFRGSLRSRTSNCEVAFIIPEVYIEKRQLERTENKIIFHIQDQRIPQTYSLLCIGDDEKELHFPYHYIQEHWIDGSVERK